MSLPHSFQYMVSRASQTRRSILKCVPRGSSTVNMNSQINFDLPSDTILDLTTLNFRADFVYQNAPGGTGSARSVPQVHTLFRSRQWALNNQIVGGANDQNFGRVYECLRRCSSSREHANGCQNEYRNVPLVNSSGQYEGSFLGSNSTAQQVCFSDFGSLQHCKNAANMDSALLGNISLILQLAGTEICMGYEDSGTAINYDWQLQNVELTIEVINFVGADNVYDQIMSEMLSSGETLNIAYPEIYSQIASNNSALKFNVSTQCLDALGFAALRSSYNTATTLDSTGGAVENAQARWCPTFSQFAYDPSSSGTVLGYNDKISTYYWTLNSAQIPQWGEYVSRGVQHTQDAFAKPNDLNARNLLFYGNWSVDNNTYTLSETVCRENFPLYNAIIVHRLALDGPAWGSGSMLSGVNCQGQSSVINLQQTTVASANSTLLFALTTAVLSVGLGQQISITY